MNLEIFSGEYSIYRLPAFPPSTQPFNSERQTSDSRSVFAAIAAEQSDANSFCSLSFTPDEISLVGRSTLRDQIAAAIPDSEFKSQLKIESGFFCFRVADQLAFDAIGIIAAISQLFADHAIPIFSISTFDTDYFLAGERHRERSNAVLLAEGYEIRHRI